MVSGLLLLVLACGGDDAPTVDPVDTAGTETATETGIEADATCTIEETCDRVVNECSVPGLSWEFCESYYSDGAGRCSAAEVPEFRACICDCFEAPSCFSGLSCGDWCTLRLCGND